MGPLDHMTKIYLMFTFFTRSHVYINTNSLEQYSKAKDNYHEPELLIRHRNIKKEGVESMLVKFWNRTVQIIFSQPAKYTIVYWRQPNRTMDSEHRRPEIFYTNALVARQFGTPTIQAT